MSRPVIAIDIDDVVCGSIEATRLWANAKANIDLQPEHYMVPNEYWNYFNRVWMTHELSDVLQYDDFVEELVADQAHMPLLAGAEFGIKELMKTYDVVFVTARNVELEPSTRKWLNDAFGYDVPLYFSKNPHQAMNGKSKGEVCKELGAWLLIDDHADNCQSALDSGLEAIMFGKYGWQQYVPEKAHLCADWPEVLEFLNARG